MTNPLKINSMKYYVPLLLTAMLMFTSIAETSALTSQITHSTITSSTEQLPPELFQNFFFQPTFGNLEAGVSLNETTPLTQDNLNLLYFVCIALVLINLIAQIKIIYQMVDLFWHYVMVILRSSF